MLNTSAPSTSGRCAGHQLPQHSGHGSVWAPRSHAAKQPARAWRRRTGLTPAAANLLHDLWSSQPCQCASSSTSHLPASTSHAQRRSVRCRADGSSGAPPPSNNNGSNWMQRFRQVSGELASDWQYVPPNLTPPPKPPTDGKPATQSGRLRALMGNLGMVAVPGMAGVAMASSLAQQSQPQQQEGSQQGGPTNGGPPPPPQPPKRHLLSAAEATEWGSDWTEDWDPEEDLSEEARATLADEAERQQRASRGKGPYGTPRDKWITPLLDIRSVTGAVDPDQERTEDNLQGEALANKDESQTAIRYAAQLFVIPLLTGFVLSRALADPVLNYTLQNNSEAFAMTDRQKIEGAEKVHIEEARLRFDMAIGKIPPMADTQILEHLREFAYEIQEEERLQNEQNLITVVSDSISSIVLFTLISQSSRGRQALFNTLSRLFEGLSDIAKAVLIILVADTLLGYHSEEGWTGLIELIVGHYGFEAEEEALVIFVGVVPVVIDVFFKYWIFIGLNRISPGAVITLKQIDTH